MRINNVRTIQSGMFTVSLLPSSIPGTEPAIKYHINPQLTCPNDACTNPVANVKKNACTMSVPTSLLVGSELIISKIAIKSDPLPTDVIPTKHPPKKPSAIAHRTEDRRLGVADCLHRNKL